MPARDFPTGAPCWTDLLTSDLEASSAFYGELLGWDAEAPAEEFGGYVNFTKKGERVAGANQIAGDQPVPDVWTIYLVTDDADKTIAAASQHGGQVAVPAMVVGDLGTMGVVTDPSGAAIGLWQPGAHKGFGLVNEPGTPGWFELHTRAYDAAVPFYREVFGWDARPMSDTPEFRYTTLNAGDEQYAGIMDASAFLPEGAPSFWTVYFHVADTDESVATATKLGASVVHPAEDTPYGRLATLTDPTGALFKLMAP